MGPKYWVCGKCNHICEPTEFQSSDTEEFWGAPVQRVSYETLSNCCDDDCHTVAEWLQNKWPVPDMPLVDLIEYGFLESKT